MALSQDLMGLGLPGHLAARLASGGTGPLTIAPTASSSYANALKIKTAQFVVSASDAGGGLAIGLPAVGGDNGALLGDDYVINNAGTTTMTVWASSGITISCAGSNNSRVDLPYNTAIAFYPISTSQWAAVKGS